MERAGRSGGTIPRGKVPTYPVGERFPTEVLALTSGDWTLANHRHFQLPSQIMFYLGVGQGCVSGSRATWASSARLSSVKSSHFATSSRSVVFLTANGGCFDIACVPRHSRRQSVSPPSRWQPPIRCRVAHSGPPAVPVPFLGYRNGR